ncbi:N-acetylmuramoyl-L-alanine amidase-like domain-containing protein [Legionella fairfieldensis]|uniref:N-acetylmuramoyl-L-alanine amidase-like domain-containing protein n=1 Tax=Legionella fairfieldensis TaxID=45064 RepID=UPI0006842B92|nr:N-acetylmuramoyl-L-alanine amidase-like domain-containing protein [Legionella fairfieldensis]
MVLIKGAQAMALHDCSINYLKPFVLSVSLCFLPLKASAVTHPKQQEADKTISQLYHKLNALPISDMSTRLDVISAQFLGKVYRLGALGEGANARFDQEPRYRTDAFDCDTYVTTVLALALANNKHYFAQCMRKVRYKQGHVSFITRNHFISLDWNPNNQHQHFIKDITQSFKDKNNKQVAKIAEALIDKLSWYQHFSIKTIRLNSTNKKEQKKRLTELKEKGSHLPITKARIPYLPFTALFDSAGHPDPYLFSQIPDGAIIEIVRPDWNLRKQIGTNLNVSHLGFAFRKQGILYFRQASSQYGEVVEVPLIDYLHKVSTSPTIKGINVEVVVPTKPLDQGCIS